MIWVANLGYLFVPNAHLGTHQPTWEQDTASASFSPSYSVTSVCNPRSPLLTCFTSRWFKHSSSTKRWQKEMLTLIIVLGKGSGNQEEEGSFIVFLPLYLDFLYILPLSSMWLLHCKGHLSSVYNITVTRYVFPPKTKPSQTSSLFAKESRWHILLTLEMSQYLPAQDSSGYLSCGITFSLANSCWDF